MFARINCPACQHKFTIPEGDMGKRQMCPSCKSPFMAGKTDADSQESPAPAMTRPQAADPSYNKTMLGGDGGPPIKFGCPRCKKALEVPSIEAGTKRACPGCGQRLQVPAAPPPPSAPAGLNKTVLASDESKAEPIRYNCPNCKKPMESPAIEALSKKNCPACGQRFQIPASSTSGAPRPNLSKTVLASDESNASPSGAQAGQTAAGATPGTTPAGDTVPVSLNVSKKQLLIGGSVLAVGLLFLMLIACVATIFIGSNSRAEAAQLEAMKAKLLKDQEAAERKAEQDRREHEVMMANLRNQGLKASQIKEAEDAAEQRRQAHERELATIRANAAAAAAAAAAARPPWYRGGYWYGGHWYPY